MGLVKSYDLFAISPKCIKEEAYRLEVGLNEILVRPNCSDLELMNVIEKASNFKDFISFRSDHLRHCEFSKKMAARYRKIPQTESVPEQEEQKKARAENIELVTAKIHAAIWVIAAAGIVYYCDIYSLVLHSTEINRLADEDCC